MSKSAAKIQDIIITPVAFHDPPLLNAVGVHEPFALRSIIEVITDQDQYGLGESYGDSTHISRLQAAAKKIKGLSIYDTNAIYRACAESLNNDQSTGGDGMAGMVTTASVTDKVFSPFEVACLDAQGKILQRQPKYFGKGVSSHLHGTSLVSPNHKKSRSCGLTCVSCLALVNR